MTGLPYWVATVLAKTYAPTVQQYQLIKSFSLLLLGMFLSSLATLNFSLAFLVGLFASPLTFVTITPKRDTASMSRTVAAVVLGILILNASPPGVLILWRVITGGSAGDVLRQAAFGWNVWGMYTPVVVWCVWWPAWLAGSVLFWSKPPEAGKSKTA